MRLLDVADLPDDVRLTLNAENVSDTEYFEDFAKGPGRGEHRVPQPQRRACLSR